MATKARRVQRAVLRYRRPLGVLLVVALVVLVYHLAFMGSP